MNAVNISELKFSYTTGEVCAPVVDIAQLDISVAQRVLMIGGNGAGKTTLLRLISGRFLIPLGMIRVFGYDAFSDRESAHIARYLGGYYGFDVDIPVKDIIESHSGDRHRAKDLADLLSIDPGWRMHRISDGQRRRVQLYVGLRQRYKLLLLDEITTDLDMLARRDLLSFLKNDSKQNGTTIIYATHIVDGLNDWFSRIIGLSKGRIRLDDDATLSRKQSKLADTTKYQSFSAEPLYKRCLKFLTEK